MLHDPNIYLSLTIRMKMARDAALGMNWLHLSTPKFIHRDLKTSNLLVDENLRVKVSVWPTARFCCSFVCLERCATLVFRKCSPMVRWRAIRNRRKARRSGWRPR
jgi:serine/threonine protein kinase